MILQDLVDDIGETCNIGVLHDFDYVHLQRIECQWPLRMHQDIGTRMPAHTVPGGKVLLASEETKLKDRKKQYRELLDKKKEIEGKLSNNQISLPASSELPYRFSTRGERCWRRSACTDPCRA